MPYVSKFANSKLAFRAVQLKDTKMLKKLLKDANRIRSVCLTLQCFAFSMCQREAGDYYV